jgi:hypothetical protein
MQLYELAMDDAMLRCFIFSVDRRCPDGTRPADEALPPGVGRGILQDIALE